MSNIYPELDAILAEEKRKQDAFWTQCVPGQTNLKITVWKNHSMGLREVFVGIYENHSYDVIVLMIYGERKSLNRRNVKSMEVVN